MIGVMKMTALAKTIETLLENKKYSSLRDVLSSMNEADIAAMFSEVSSDSLPLLFRLLPKDLAADTFALMDTDEQELLIRGFSDNEIKEVFDELYVDDAADIVEEMPANVVKRILKNTEPDMRQMINEILKYPEDSAGSLMTTDYISLRPKMTISDAIKRIRRTINEAETIYTCYVTDDNRKLLGYLSVKNLLLAEPNEKVCDIMDKTIICVHTLSDKEDVAKDMNKYDFVTMPVVDDEGRLVGIVTFDDAIDVIQEEATEDIEKMAAILPSNRTYFRTGVFSTFKARIPWLLLLMISATFTGAIISNFEEKLTVLPALIAFIPMLMDTGGNSGSQSSVTIIRGISLGDIEFRDIFKVIWKEVRVALLCSTALALVNFVKMILVDYLMLHSFDPGKQIAEIAVVCLTLFFTVIVAKIVGCTLPILAKKVGFDPAVMASPFITTIVDAISLFIYFNIAISILGI